MKIILNVAVLLFVGFGINAQTLIAVHNEAGSSFYANLDSAIVNSVAGDFIYLPGGSFKISVPIDKKLQIVGVGHNPDSCVTTGITQVRGLFSILNGSDNGSITGIKISGGIYFGTQPNDVSINNYYIERCNIDGIISLPTRSTNIVFNECIIHYYILGNGAKSFQMTKCIFEGSYINGIGTNSYFGNNIFIGPTYDSYFKGCYFKNNIFLSSVGYLKGTDNIFQNNSFTNSSMDGGSSVNNIVVPVADLFVNKTKTGFDYDQDYHLLPDSPARNAGTDGTDLGIYGTESPWKEGSLPGNPHIQSKMISTLDRNLKVKIKVAAQNN